MAELTETRVRSIIREELKELNVFDLPVQVERLDGKIIRLDGKVDIVRTELKAEIQNVRTELKGDIARLETKVDSIQNQNDKMGKMMITFFITTIVVIIGAMISAILT